MKSSRLIIAAIGYACLACQADVVSFVVSTGSSALAMQRQPAREIVVPAKPGQWAKLESDEFAAYPGLIVKRDGGDCLVGDGAREPLGFEVSVRKAQEAQTYEISWAYRVAVGAKAVKVAGCESLGELLLPSIEERRGKVEATIKVGEIVEVGAFDFDMDAARRKGSSSRRALFKIEAERLR